MANNTLIVGASGGIGQALVKQYAQNSDHVYAVTRATKIDSDMPNNVSLHSMKSQNDAAISEFVKGLKSDGIALSTVVITTGFLHNDDAGIHPEKRLEDISEDAMAQYFAVNTIIPSLWVKQLVNVMNKHNATVICLSARVGSISDNALGGWYGYRASKAALNMMMKTASVEYKRRLKDAMLVCYHPGTVDTSLSKPFQKNVAAKKLFTPDYTASQLITHVASLDREQVCHFIDWNGEVVTW